MKQSREEKEGVWIVGGNHKGPRLNFAIAAGGWIVFMFVGFIIESRYDTDFFYFISMAFFIAALFIRLAWTLQDQSG